MIYLGFVQSQISYNTHHFDGSHFLGQNIPPSDWLMVSANHRLHCEKAICPWLTIPFLRQANWTDPIIEFQIAYKSFNFSDWSKS